MTASDWTTFGKTSGGKTGGKFIRPGSLKDGESMTFRVLGSPLEYFERWTVDKKPVLIRFGEPWPADKKWREGKEGKVKDGKAIPIYHYEQEKVVILSFTQGSIVDQFLKYIKHAKYGEPTRYDLTLTRKGSGFDDTEYALVADPPEPVSEKVMAAWNAVLEAGFDLNELFTGGDPFAPTGNSKPENDVDIPF